MRLPSALFVMSAAPCGLTFAIAVHNALPCGPPRMPKRMHASPHENQSGCIVRIPNKPIALRDPVTQAGHSGTIHHARNGHVRPLYQ